MTHLVRPFAALRPRQDTAQAVIAPPYDVVDTDEARAMADGHPESFLHISRPEIDLPAGTDPYSDAVYDKGAENLARLIDRQILERDASECFYVYRMQQGDHSQTGVALAASIDAYRKGLIHAHEKTRPDKENDRVRNIDSLNAQTGPVMLTYKASAAVDGILSRAAAGEPLFEAVGQHDVTHTIWRIDDPDAVAELNAALDGLGELYIADGHHRSAAAARVAAARQGADQESPASHDYFLSVAFPDDQMKIYDYNRVVKDLNGLSAEAVLDAVGQNFDAAKVDQPARPQEPGTFGMYLAGAWYRLTLKQPPPDDPVASLDVSLLQDRLIAPVLGVGDPRTDSRIEFVGGVRGLGELERRVDSGRGAVSFALYPTSVRALMAVADAGLLMPPKSTWFEPKLADGLLTHVLD